MKYTKLIISFLILVVFVSIVYSKTLNITNIDKKYNSNGNIKIEFNNLLEIYNLKIVEFNKIKSINSPKYKSKSSSYNYFSFLDRNFQWNVINCIEQNIIQQNIDTEITYKINKFKVINSKTLKATFSIIFNDLFEVNATIMYGKNGLWVQWPSLKDNNNKWKKLFIIKDSQFKKNIETKILNEYNNLKDDKNNK